jgi:hypothetical protein
VIALLAPPAALARHDPAGDGSADEADSMAPRDSTTTPVDALPGPSPEVRPLEPRGHGIFFGADARDNVRMARFDRELRLIETRFSRRLRGWLLLVAAASAWGAALLGFWGIATLLAVVFPGSP